MPLRNSLVPIALCMFYHKSIAVLALTHVNSLLTIGDYIQKVKSVRFACILGCPLGAYKCNVVAKKSAYRILSKISDSKKEFKMRVSGKFLESY